MSNWEFLRFQAIISKKIGQMQIIFSISMHHHSSLSYHMWSVALKGQRSTSRPRAMLKPFFGPIFAIFEDIWPFCRGFSLPFEWFTTVFCIFYSFGAMPRSILAKISNCHINLKIAPFATLINIKVLNTYGVIVSSPKQFDINRSKV